MMSDKGIQFILCWDTPILTGILWAYFSINLFLWMWALCWVYTTRVWFKDMFYIFSCNKNDI